MQVDLLKSLLKEFHADNRYKYSNFLQIKWTLSDVNGDVETITAIKDPDNSFINEVTAARVCNLLSNFKSIQSLIFDEIDLTFVPFAKVCAVDSLRSLKLVHSSSADTPFVLPPNAFQGMTKLESLALGNVASAGLEEIAELKALKCLAIHKSDLEDLPVHFGKLENLKQLEVMDSKLLAIPPVVFQLRYLTSLDLNSNQIAGHIPPSISALRSLKTLNFSNNKLTGGLQNLAQLTELQEVDVMNNSISGYSLGLNPVDAYFLERIYGVNYPSSGKGMVVNFANWSPVVYCESEHHVNIDNVLLYPQLLIKYPKYIMKKADNPVILANKIFPALLMFLRKLCEAQNPCVLNALARLWYAFTYAAKKHPAEEDELLSFADEIAAITMQLFKCNALDDVTTFYRLVLPQQYWPGKPSSSTNARTIIDELNGQLWSIMHVFEEDTPIKLCMDCGFKQVLASPAVANIIGYLFCNGIVKEDETDVISRIWNSILCPRYTPVVLFLVEGLSKVVVLVLVASVTIGVYGRDGHTAFANSTAEGFLLLMLFTQLCYEVGQVDAVRWSLKKHFSDIWNGLDAAALTLIAFWALLCCFPRQFDVARTLLSLSSIPLSLQMLQYISLVKEIGLLVLMIKSMILDVMVFVLVYVVSIFGFGVCFYGLFYGESSFHSSGTTLLYLFQSTLGNFDFEALSGTTYTGIGTVVLVVFLVLTSVLLVNLLIAQMSSTYSRIKEKSREEWSYIMASYAQEFILLRERTPLCMVPPPFNAITTALAPLHYWALPRYKISIAGTVADYVLGIVLVPFYPIYVFLVLRQIEFQDWKRFWLNFLYIGMFLPFVMTYIALLRIFYFIVRVVPASKPNVPPVAIFKDDDNAYHQQYDIWYDVYMQREEAKSTNPAPAEATDGGEGSATNGTDGVQLQCLSPASGGEQSATVSALHGEGAGSPTNVPPSGTPAAVKTASVPTSANKKGSGDLQRVVVLYTDEDICRMFPPGADGPHYHHLARHRADTASAVGGADTATSLEAALEEVKAQNARLQVEVADLKADMKAEQADMKASQAEILAIVKTLVKK